MRTQTIVAHVFILFNKIKKKKKRGKRKVNEIIIFVAGRNRLYVRLYLFHLASMIIHHPKITKGNFSMPIGSFISNAQHEKNGMEWNEGRRDERKNESEKVT